MSSTNTRPSVTDKLVRAAVLGQVGADHFRLDFDRLEDFAVVHADNRADHLGNDDHVTQMRLDHLWLLMLGGLLLCLVELLDEGHRLTGETAVELPARTRRQQRQQFDRLHRQQSVQVHSTERKLLERAALALNGRFVFRHDDLVSDGLELMFLRQGLLLFVCCDA